MLVVVESDMHHHPRLPPNQLSIFSFNEKKTCPLFSVMFWGEFRNYNKMNLLLLIKLVV